MLTAYFDESGTHDGAPVLAVAGYVATALQWSRLDRMWRQFLDEEHLPYLHMTDMVRRASPYEDFKQLDEDRILMRARFIMSDCKLAGVAAGVHRQDYRDVVKDDAIAFNKIGSPYTLCATTAIHQVAEWVWKNVGEVPVNYVFGDIPARIEGIKVKGELMDLVDQYRRSPSLKKRFLVSQPAQFLDAQTVRPLQAADVQAYEATTHLNLRLGYRYKDRDASAAKLLASVAHDNNGFWDKENLAELARLVKTDETNGESIFRHQGLIPSHDGKRDI